MGGDVKLSFFLLDLPMRDGNTSRMMHHGSIWWLLDLPMRDGNVKMAIDEEY